MDNLFPFGDEIILQNEWALLQPMELDDFEHLLSYAIHEPELWTYSLLSAASELELKHYIQLALDGREKQKEYPFCIIDKRTGRVVGTTRYYDIQMEHKTLLIGYTWIGKEFQGTGINLNCKYLLLNYAFEKLKMERVEFRADYRNKRSVAAMKKIGCKVEGILRSNCSTSAGERRDSIVLSILKEEWNCEVENKIQQLIQNSIPSTKNVRG